MQALCGAVTAVQSVLLVAFSHRVQETLGAGSGRLSHPSGGRWLEDELRGLWVKP